MSISRQVLTSPFDIPSKPRPSHSSNNSSVNHRVNNIMSDSRVVRRSTFNPAVAKKVDNKTGQCIIFDTRLMKGNVFASPIITVIDTVKENRDVNCSSPNVAMKRKKKRVKPKDMILHNISTQTEDNIVEMSTIQIQYVSTSVQTEIRCSLNQILIDETVSREEEVPELNGASLQMDVAGIGSA